MSKRGGDGRALITNHTSVASHYNGGEKCCMYPRLPAQLTHAREVKVSMQQRVYSCNNCLPPGVCTSNYCFSCELLVYHPQATHRFGHLDPYYPCPLT